MELQPEYIVSAPDRTVDVYAGNNTDFRGKCDYWAARDSERVGKVSEEPRNLVDSCDSKAYRPRVDSKGWSFQALPRTFALPAKEIAKQFLQFRHTE